MNTDFWYINRKSGVVYGGRHPPPEIDQFRIEIEKAGINNTKTVVAYDGGEGQFASRFWRLLNFLEQEKVYVLNESFKGWVEAGHTTTKEEPECESAKFEVTIQKEMLASYDDVKEIVANKKQSPILIDSRDKVRYLGEVESVDKIAGHANSDSHCSQATVVPTLSQRSSPV